MRLTIELLSDLCAGTGEASGGAVDTAVAEDEYGIPVIPGRRIKGLFREAAEELMDHGLASAADVAAVFGTPGGGESGIHFGTLYPVGYEKMRSLLEAMKKDGAWGSHAERERVQDFYTTVRTQTAIGVNGVADDNTLRSSRVVCQKCKGDENHGNRVFEGEIDIPESLKKQYGELLGRCAKMVRHIGLNRTRGYGNVVCRVEPHGMAAGDNGFAFAAQTDQGKILTDSAAEGNAVLGVHLILEQPCVLEENFISGRALMGSFASAFLKRTRAAGEDIQNIHENDLFQTLFLSGEVQYGFCWPYENKRVHEPLPKSLVKEKYGKDTKLYDLTACEREDLAAFMDGKEKAGAMFAAFEEEHIYYSEVQRETRNHHRRPEDRAIGRATGKDGKGDRSTGQLYSFDLVRAGQEFYGEIRGKQPLLKELQKLVKNGDSLYFGAGRTAEYGKVQVYWKQAGWPTHDVEPDERTVITLCAPFAAEDVYGNESTALLDVLRAIFPERELSELMAHTVPFFEERVYSGYQAKWGMPLPQRTALASGSEIVIYGMELSEEEAARMERTSYGRYTEEGYGRIAVNRHGENESLSFAKEPKNTVARWPEAETQDGSETPESVRFLEVCLKDRLYQTCEKTECMEKIKRHLEKVPGKSVLGGVMQIVRTSGNFEELKQQLKQAGDRVSEKNAKWCVELGRLIFGSSQEELIFLKDSVWKMQGDAALKNIPLSWRADERWRAMLDGDAGFRVFQDILNQKLCEVHLKKGRREQ